MNATNVSVVLVHVPPQVVFTVLLVGIAIFILLIVIILIVKSRCDGRCAVRDDSSSVSGESAVTEQIECVGIHLPSRTDRDSKETQTESCLRHYGSDSQLGTEAADEDFHPYETVV